MLLVNIVYATKKAYKCEKIRYDSPVSSNLLKKLDLPAAEKLAGFFCLKQDGEVLLIASMSGSNFAPYIFDLSALDFTLETPTFCPLTRLSRSANDRCLSNAGDEFM